MLLKSLCCRELLAILIHLVFLAQPSNPRSFSEFVAVRTSTELVDAIKAGAQHILVIKHLDLTNVEIQGLSNEPVNNDDDYYYNPVALLPVKNSTLTIRGHCIDELDITLLEGSAAIDRRPGQCCLLFEEGPVLVTDYPAGHLWIHNIYFRRNGGARTFGIIGTAGQSAVNPTVFSELCLLDVTLQGDGRKWNEMEYTVTSGMSSASKVYMEGCSFRDLTIAALVLLNTFASYVDCVIEKPSESAFVVEMNALSYLRLENTSVIGGDALLASSFPSDEYYYTEQFVFTDDLQTVEVSNTTATIAPLDQSDEFPFLRPTDAWVSAVRKDTCRGAFRSASGGSAPFLAPCLNIPGYDVLPESFGHTDKMEEEANDGALIGGAIAGGVAVLIVTGVVILICLRCQRSSTEASCTAKQITETDTGAVSHMEVRRAASDATREPLGTERQLTATEAFQRHVYHMPRSPSNQGSGIQTLQPLGVSGEVPTQTLQLVPRVQLTEGPGAAGAHRSRHAFLTRPLPLLSGSCMTDSLRIMSTRKTASVADQVDKLEDALDSTRRAGMLLCSRYEVLSSTARRVGGQGCVQFVFDKEQRVECAVKFFFARRHFDHERALYGDASLRSAMAATREVCANDDGIITAANGARFPPFIILERGESLDEFQRLAQARELTAGSADSYDIVTAAQTMIHTATRVEALHNLGWVHRDLKPSNVLRVPRLHTWALIDFGSTSRIGEEARIEFTPAYAAPEVIRAYTDGEATIVARPAMDVWALGLIAFEVLTGAPPFPPQATRDEMFAMLLGRERLPWEGSEHDAAVAERVAKLQAFKRGVLECLDRDPLQRPPVTYIVSAWRHVFSASVSTAHHNRVVASSRTM